MGANCRVLALVSVCLFVCLFHARAGDTPKTAAQRVEFQDVRQQIEEARADTNVPVQESVAESSVETVAASAPSGTNSLSPEDEKTFSGVYRSSNGERISLGRSKDDGSWIMATGDETVYRLEGDRSKLSISEVQRSLPSSSGHVKVVADGRRMYGKAVRDGHTIEFYAGNGGDVELAVDGGKASKMPTTAGESELRLIAKDFAEVWSTTRRTTFSVSSNSFSAIPGAVGSSRAKPALGPSFSKAADLTDEEVAALKVQRETFKQSFNEADGFAKRNQ